MLDGLSACAVLSVTAKAHADAGCCETVAATEEVQAAKAREAIPIARFDSCTNDNERKPKVAGIMLFSENQSEQL